MDSPTLPLFTAIRGAMTGSWPEDEYDLAESPLSFVDYRGQEFDEMGKPIDVAPATTVLEDPGRHEIEVKIGEVEEKAEGAVPIPVPAPEPVREPVCEPVREPVCESVHELVREPEHEVGPSAAIEDDDEEEEEEEEEDELELEEDEGTVIGLELIDNNPPTWSRRNTLFQTEDRTSLFSMHSYTTDSSGTISINSDIPAEVSTAVQVRIFSSPPPSSVTTLSLDRHDSGFFFPTPPRPETPLKQTSIASLPPSPPPSPPSIRRQAVVMGQSLIERTSTASTTTSTTRVIRMNHTSAGMSAASLADPSMSNHSLPLSAAAVRARFSSTSIAAPGSVYSSPKSSRFFEVLSDENNSAGSIRPGTGQSVETLARLSKPLPRRPYTASAEKPASFARPRTAPEVPRKSDMKGWKKKKIDFSFLKIKGCGVKLSIPKWGKKEKKKREAKEREVRMEVKREEAGGDGVARLRKFSFESDSTVSAKRKSS